MTRSAVNPIKAPRARRASDTGGFERRATLALGKRVGGLLILLLCSQVRAARAVPVCQTYSGDTATVCGSGPPTTCTVTFYVIEVCADSSQGHETPPHGPPVHLPEYISDQDDPADENGNNKIDDWGAVVDTSDNCSKNFDLNDRLGTNYGGTNTERPDHTGVDIQANIGDTVASMAFGRVVDVGNGVGGADCGKAVKIVNLFASGINGTTAVYCHLSSTSVQKGEFVIAGQDIGEVGMTGATTGPHLHISLWATTSSNSQRLEYFNYVDNGPTTAQLNPNGC